MFNTNNLFGVRCFQVNIWYLIGILETIYIYIYMYQINCIDKNYQYNSFDTYIYIYIYIYSFKYSYQIPNFFKNIYFNHKYDR